MHPVRYASGPTSSRRGTTTSSVAGEAEAKQKVREVLRQGEEHRKAAAPTKTRRKPSSTPLVTPTTSPPSKRRPPTKTVTPKAAATAARANGDPAAAPSHQSPPVGGGTGYKGYGRPFARGNTVQRRARNRLTDEEIRDEVRCAMSRVTLRRLVKRLGTIASRGSNRDSIAASRLLMTLVGADTVVKANASEQGTMIEIPAPPER